MAVEASYPLQRYNETSAGWVLSGIDFAYSMEADMFLPSLVTGH